MSSNNFQHYKSLGQLIKDYRQWRKINQDEFAELIKVSVRQLRRWEAGLSHASVENLQDIAEATGIPMEACIALNADNPLWYSLQKRRFAYTSIEVDLVRVNSAPSIFEIKLDILAKKMKNYNHPLAVDTPLSVDEIYSNTKKAVLRHRYIF